MSDSDDFGIDEDDTAFLAAATQAEDDQDEFEASPRPAKRRRIVADEESDSDSAFEAFVGDLRDGTAGGETQESPNDSGNEDCYLRGELGDAVEDARRAHMERYKIHVPKNAVQFSNIFVTQTQAGINEHPAAIRGPIWKKPAPTPLPQAPQQMPPPAQHERSLGRSASTSNLDSFILKPNRNAHNQLQAKRQLQSKIVNTMRPVSKSADTSFADEFDIHSDDFEGLVDTELDLVNVEAPTGRRAPRNGLKQMTIFGQAATQELTSTQAAKKKHSWPAKARDEPPTHHELDAAALETYIYPTNLGAIRDYQFNIVSRSLMHNTLVALPTGLGKTFIAATVMLNYYRWTKKAQIVFLAPTKPLIAQQMEACYGIVGIPKRDTILMTGETQPAIRAEEWQDRRVFFMTPQTLINDLKTGICDPKRLVLIVVDEAHKATGGYAYTEVVKFLHRFNPSFRVLALTATPGSTVEAVQAVINNLGIARVELRTEASIDIRQFTHEKHTETELFSFSEEQTLIMGHISKAIQPVLDKLTSQNAYWSRDPMALTAFGCTTARGKWMSSEAGKKSPYPVKAMVNSIFTVLASLSHSLSLLKFHGIGIFYSGLISFQKSLDDKGRGKYARQIAESADFSKAMNYMRGWTNNIDFVGHPKMEYLREVITNHFLDAGEGRDSTAPVRSTRVMIFSSFRDSTDEICRVLKRSEPLVRPHVFVGQAASKSSEGMDQKKQNKVIQQFKDGTYNTLVATSIGEEGLDIGDVDLIICYDASSSPIRMLQRIGRTGRKRVGRVVLLLMRGKEENDYAKAQDSYAFIQKTIADDTRYEYCDDESPRIMPKEISPTAVRQIVEIPPENSQPIDLNERARRRQSKGKAKKPPKKFHMPDGVNTGFVKASDLRSEAGTDSDDSSKPVRRAIANKSKQKATSKQKAVTLPDVAAVPFLQDVLLNNVQVEAHESKYMQGVVDFDRIRVPDPGQHPEHLRQEQPSKYVKRSLTSRVYKKALDRLHNLTDLEIESVTSRVRLSSADLDRAISTRLSKRRPVFPTSTAADQESVLVPGKTAVARETGKGAAKQATDRSGPLTKANANGAKRKRGRRTSAASDPMEGSESEPEATPPDMRIGTQGIDLGSTDTSGEDAEESADSELEQFIVNSDQPIDMATSSVPMEHEFSSSMPKANRKRGRLKKTTARKFTEIIEADAESLSDNGLAEDTEINDEPIARKHGRVVAESDSDE